LRVRAPSPAGSAAHPKACDTIESLRWRWARGPRRARDADAVVVLIPGFLGGAGSFDQLARMTVEKAAAKGRHIEVWALDRRSNCLEEDRGVVAAAKAKNPAVAYDYYWRGKAVGGRTFPGFVTPGAASWLKDVGLAQTMRDWYRVLKAAIPNRATRARKIVCGGHSLGGPLTAAFASWDFDGNPKTVKDAGYAQCAGLVGLDTDVSLARGGGAGGAGGGGSTGSSASPYVNAPPLTPETFQLPPIFGVGSWYHPQRTDLLKKLPHTTNIDLSQRLLFSRDAANFATGSPGIRDFTTTNQVTLAGVFDDNSAPLSFLRSSVGSLTGGPVVQKNFPTPDPTLALPGDPKAKLYRWQNYDKVGTTPIAKNDEGRPFTSRESEVSDVGDLARTMWEAPANFIEQYFPTRILSDVAAAGAGDRGGSLAALQHDGPAHRPVAEIDAGDSQSNSGPDTGRPVTGTPPNGRKHSRRVTLPGYNHLDVLTAARKQNDGRAEPASTALAAYTLAVVPSRPRMALVVHPRRVRSGTWVTFRVHVTSAVPRCRGGVHVRLGHLRATTSKRGRAIRRARFARRGTFRVRAAKAGCRPTSAIVRIRPRRG
jgi:hypothetical protein